MDFQACLHPPVTCLAAPPLVSPCLDIGNSRKLSREGLTTSKTPLAYLQDLAIQTAAVDQTNRSFQLSFPGTQWQKDESRGCPVTTLLHSSRNDGCPCYTHCTQEKRCNDQCWCSLALLSNKKRYYSGTLHAWNVRLKLTQCNRNGLYDHYEIFL